MCGIAGFFSTGRQLPDGAVRLEWATKSIEHRGPDDDGHVLFNFGTDRRPLEWRAGSEPAEDARANCGLGFRRLAIHDLSAAGHQPMSAAEGRVWIIFNGEIYNFVELREELKGLGHSFRSRTDTEVILAAYLEWGRECVHRFNGMWGFALLDLRESGDPVFWLCRDRLGVKPVYWTESDNEIWFASEMKALFAAGFPAVPDEEKFFLFFARGVQPAGDDERTFFSGILALKPGHSLIARNGGRQIEKWWDIRDIPEPASLPQESPIDEFAALFEDAVKLRLDADVPVGSCLSGGVDSSAIVCVVDRLLREGITAGSGGSSQHTFSAVYDEKGRFNEIDHITKVLDCVSAVPHYTKPSGEGLAQHLDALAWHQEEPFPTLSIYAQWCVMAEAKKAGVTVLLDGQGADEAFGGYRPFGIALRQTLQTQGLLAALREFRAVRRTTGDNHWKVFLQSLAMWAMPDLLVRHLVARGFRNRASEALARMNMLPQHRMRAAEVFSARRTDAVLRNHRDPRGLDLHLKEEVQSSSLPRLLQYEDRNSMAFSLEGRTPFVDYRLIKFAFGQASDARLIDGWTKWIVRKSMDGVVPPEILWRRDKVGFETPEPRLLSELAQRRPDLFKQDSPLGQWFDMDAVRERWKAMSRGELNAEESREVWRLASAERSMLNAGKASSLTVSTCPPP